MYSIFINIPRLQIARTCVTTSFSDDGCNHQGRSSPESRRWKAEKEAQVMVTPNPIIEEETEPFQITQEQRRQIQQIMAETSTINPTNNPSFLFLDMSSEEMSRHQ
jgi:hypothetical protein